MKEFQKEKDILDGLEQAEKVGNKCDWKNEQDISIMRSEKYKTSRKVLLDKIVPTRVCPSCRRRIYLESSWVVTKDSLVICRSCFHSRKGVSDKQEVSGGFLKEPIIRFSYDGWKIKSLRERGGVGVNSFADKMGWSKKYQYEIESGDVRSLSLEVVERLIKVFESFGVNITDGG